MLRRAFLSILKQFGLRAALGGENGKKLAGFRFFKNASKSEPSRLEQV